MVHAARGGENYGTSWGKRQTHKTLTGDFEIRQAVRRDLHNPASAGERCRDVEIAVHVEGQSLRSSQTFVESVHGSVGVDFVNAVGGAGHEQIALRVEGQMIGGDADLERGEDEDLLVAG